MIIPFNICATESFYNSRQILLKIFVEVKNKAVPSAIFLILFSLSLAAMARDFQSQTSAMGKSPSCSLVDPEAIIYFINHTASIDTISACSTTLPKPILDNQSTYDTINVTFPGFIVDLNVNLTIYHTWDSDVSIYLISPNHNQIDLSSGNGGSGDNYINTTFDDEALMPITAGSPPFTGSFRPEQLLSTFDNLPLTGSWVLKVTDNAAGDTGQLISWCLLFARSVTTGGISGNRQPLQFELAQNYPNPFNSGTRINFAISKQTDVKIVMYDVLGREVKSLVNSKLAGGRYDIYLNANDLASGIYFYTMYLDGSFFDTKKLIIVK